MIHINQTPCSWSQRGLSCDYGKQVCCNKEYPRVTFQCVSGKWLGTAIDTHCMFGGYSTLQFSLVVFFMIIKVMAVTHPMQTFRKLMILIIRRMRLKQMTMKKQQKKKMILMTTLKTTLSLLEQSLKFRKSCRQK